MARLKTQIQVAEVVPHSGGMILIDDIVDYNEDSLVASVTITDSSLFGDGSKGVPVWVGIEYMAQAVAAWAGIQGKGRDKPVKMGLLLGTRRYVANKSYFSIGCRLLITVQQVYRENELGVFDCKIEDDQIIAEAALNVYQPNN
jgi:predicted hotdog family 3-hydroxylacyl-ACP dehydratase